jgi:hypothetical protein
MENQGNDSSSSASKEDDTFAFVIDFSDPRAIEPAASAGEARHSMVVRVEAGDVLFALSAMEPETATRSLAESLAQQTAFLAIEKDFPNGVEPSLSAEQIDHIPDEFEDRLPDYCVNGNNAWLVDPRIGNAELPLANKEIHQPTDKKSS